jgi:CDP-glycerol glycerophosphotransferase (TagB/SpsB family)
MGALGTVGPVSTPRKPGGARLAHRTVGVLLSLLRLPIYFLSGFVPRDPRLVVFGTHGDRFTDNARYLFLSMADRRDLHSVWITGDRDLRAHVRSLGRDAHLRWSPRGIMAAVRAGWHVYNSYPSDINFLLSRRARLLNLWHGIPLKAILFDNRPPGGLYTAKRWSPARLRFMDRFKSPDFVVSTSPAVTTCFASAFRVPRESCLELGYPRTDHLLAPDAKAKALERLALGDRPGVGHGLIGYFPTWRDDRSDFLGAAGWDFDRINDRLAGAGRTLLFKAHPLCGDLAPAGRTWSNIVVLDTETDLNEILAACDLLVTDHSSVSFDYLLLGRPIVYFIPDRERYERARDVYFTVEEMAAGPIVTTAAELEDVVATVRLDGPPDPRIAQLRDRLWAAYSGHACEDIAAFIAARGRRST